MKKNIDAMNHPTKVKETIGERIYTIVVYLLLILISATIILPLLHIISGSFSDPMQLLTGNVSFWPKGFTTSMDTVKTANGYEMKSIWSRNDLSDTSILKLSTATGYIYGYVQDVTDRKSVV